MKTKGSRAGEGFACFAFAVLFLLLSPFICAGILGANIVSLARLPKRKKKYKASRYYIDQKKRYTSGILDAPKYRFYNAAVARELQMRYVVQKSNRLEYFIYRDTLYLFPDITYLGLYDEGARWEVYSSYVMDFDEYYSGLIAKLDAEVRDLYPVKLLVERATVKEYNLNEALPPESVFVTWKYEDAFDETEDCSFGAVLPRDTKELYHAMQQLPDLCGHLALLGNGQSIEWMLCDGVKLEICFELEATMICATDTKLRQEITHWHPEPFDILDEVYKLGRRGNVLVLRSHGRSGSLLYLGKEEDCPHEPTKNPRFGRYYYLKAV